MIIIIAGLSSVKMCKHSNQLHSDLKQHSICYCQRWV